MLGSAVKSLWHLQFTLIIIEQKLWEKKWWSILKNRHTNCPLSTIFLTHTFAEGTLLNIWFYTGNCDVKYKLEKFVLTIFLSSHFQHWILAQFLQHLECKPWYTVQWTRKCNRIVYAVSIKLKLICCNTGIGTAFYEI